MPCGVGWCGPRALDGRGSPSGLKGLGQKREWWLRWRLVPVWGWGRCYGAGRRGLAGGGCGGRLAAGGGCGG